MKKNWLNKLKEFEKLIDSWRSRKLTIFGKTQIVNSLAISKLLYTANVLNYPDQSYIKDINRIIFSFLWGKRDRIKRKSLIRTINEEGIGITDFEAKMKASKAAWVARILRDKGNLGSLMQAWLNSYNMNYLYLIQTNITKPSDFNIKQLPLFHKEVICAFNECKCKKKSFTDNSSSAKYLV